MQIAISTGSSWLVIHGLLELNCVSRQAEVSRKHRKASSQPSSCSQNTESSSTTPEPAHESSDNEGDARRRCATQKKHTSRASECDGFTTLCVSRAPGFPNQCARCNKEIKEIALMEASISSIQKTQQDIQRWGEHTQEHTVYGEVRGFMSSCQTLAEVDCHPFSVDRLLIKTGLVKL